ncbi:hypothetical protein BT93_C2023 [Corymbia citriodora subsp. variegata]|nr:hypothetical protein BT93_C2023 [Corymbia citriodora subsp. variegata]
MISSDGYVRNLKEEAVKLIDVRQRVQHSIGEAQNNTKLIEADVSICKFHCLLLVFSKYIVDFNTSLDIPTQFFTCTFNLLTISISHILIRVANCFGKEAKCTKSQ